jgi:hypothetical protein
MFNKYGELVRLIDKVIERDSTGRIVDNYKTFKNHLPANTESTGRPLSSLPQLFGWLTHAIFQDGHKVATGNTLELYGAGKSLARATWIDNGGKRSIKILKDWT